MVRNSISFRDYWHPALRLACLKGVQMDLSHSHTVRIVLCSTSTCRLWSEIIALTSELKIIPQVRTNYVIRLYPRQASMHHLFWVYPRKWFSPLTLRIYVVPAPAFDSPKIRVFPQAAPILDFIWYPRATPRDASSFCFVASVRESPVRLLDASDGRVSLFQSFHPAVPSGSTAMSLSWGHPIKSWIIVNGKLPPTV